MADEILYFWASGSTTWKQTRWNERRKYCQNKLLAWGNILSQCIDLLISHSCKHPRYFGKRHSVYVKALTAEHLSSSLANVLLAIIQINRFLLRILRAKVTSKHDFYNSCSSVSLEKYLCKAESHKYNPTHPIQGHVLHSLLANLVVTKATEQTFCCWWKMFTLSLYLKAEKNTGLAGTKRWEEIKLSRADLEAQSWRYTKLHSVPENKNKTKQKQTKKQKKSTQPKNSHDSCKF